MELDAVAVECDHASTRRVAGRTQTHVSSTSWASALRLTRKVRRQESSSWHARVGLDTATDSTQGLIPQPQRQERKGSREKTPTRRGGGGAWRCHLATSAARNPDGTWRKGALRQYRRTCQNAQLALCHLGELATQAHRDGCPGFVVRTARDSHTRRIESLLRKKRRQYFLDNNGARGIAWDRAAALQEARRAADDVLDRRLQHDKRERTKRLAEKRKKEAAAFAIVERVAKRLRSSFQFAPALHAISDCLVPQPHASTRGLTATWRPRVWDIVWSLLPEHMARQVLPLTAMWDGQHVVIADSPVIPKLEAGLAACC